MKFCHINSGRTVVAKNARYTLVARYLDESSDIAEYLRARTRPFAWRQLLPIFRAQQQLYAAMRLRVVLRNRF